ncbi:penicillin-binding protein, partial [Arthrobacter sp. GN70]|nr:penicillin-binding protein [Arthrobacter sp. GN70]
NNQTWVLGYTKGLATASFFGDPFNGGPSRLGRDVTINGKYYPVVDGAYIAGPQWAQYMQQVVGFYDHGDFDAPPQNLIGGTATSQNGNTNATANGNGYGKANGNGKGSGKRKG